MTVESAADLAGLFSDFGQSGTITLAGAGGASVVFVGILDIPEDRVIGAVGINAARARVRLPTASLPARPRRPDSVTIGGIAYHVEHTETDVTGAEYLIDLGR